MSNLVTDNDLLEYNYSDYLNPPQDFPLSIDFETTKLEEEPFIFLSIDQNVTDNLKITEFEDEMEMSNLVTDNDLLEYNYPDYLNPPQDVQPISTYNARTTELEGINRTFDSNLTNDQNVMKNFKRTAENNNDEAEKKKKRRYSKSKHKIENKKPDHNLINDGENILIVDPDILQAAYEQIYFQVPSNTFFSESKIGFN